MGLCHGFPEPAGHEQALGSLRVPVLDVLFSGLILGEEISLIIVSGLILISIGVLVVTVGDLKQLKFL